MNPFYKILLYKKWTKRSPNELERLGYLSQKNKTKEKPRPYMCNIAINSTFIEMVDLFHLTRGKCFLSVIPVFIFLFVVLPIFWTVA